MAVEQKEQKEVKYIVPTFLRIHLGAHEEATATGSGHYDARGDDACDAEAVALLCKTRTEESPYFIMRRAAQSVKIYHSTVTDTLKKL